MKVYLHFEGHSCESVFVASRLEGSVCTSDICVLVLRVLPALVRSVIEGRVCIGVVVCIVVGLVDEVCDVGRIEWRTMRRQSALYTSDTSAGL